MKKENKIKTFLNPVTKKCRLCGEEFSISPEKQKMYADKNQVLPNNCPSCLHLKYEIAYQAECIDCKKEFDVTKYEVAMCAKNEYPTPTHCYECRKKRREEKANGSAQ